MDYAQILGSKRPIFKDFKFNLKDQVCILSSGCKNFDEVLNDVLGIRIIADCQGGQLYQFLSAVRKVIGGVGKRFDLKFQQERAKEGAEQGMFYVDFV